MRLFVIWSFLLLYFLHNTVSDVCHNYEVTLLRNQPWLIAVRLKIEYAPIAFSSYKFQINPRLDRVSYTRRYFMHGSQCGFSPVLWPRNTLACFLQYGQGAGWLRGDLK